MGSGINTGIAIVGLMGSEAHIVNYTVFGREVNLASRLEGVSGHGRIIIGEATYAALQRDDPKLAGPASNCPRKRSKASAPRSGFTRSCGSLPPARPCRPKAPNTASARPLDSFFPLFLPKSVDKPVKKALLEVYRISCGHNLL